MSVKVLRERVRLECDVARGQLNIIDKITNALPDVNRAVDAQFEIGFIWNGSEMVDVSDYAAMKLEVKEVTGKTDDPLMAKTISASAFLPNAAITKAQWDAGTHQHAQFFFEKEETALGVPEETKDFWLILWATTALSTQTSGLLIPGHSYTIDSLETGDDFSNVGYVSEGTAFIATGATPTTYTNATVVTDNTLSSNYFCLGTQKITFKESGYNVGTPGSPPVAETWLTREVADTLYDALYDHAVIEGRLDDVEDDITALQAADTAFTSTGLTYTLKDGTRAFTGQVLLSNSTPSTALAAASKGYVDAQDALKASLTGATFTGEILLANSTPSTSLAAASKAYVLAQIAALVASSPSTLDTLNELATALGNDPAFATTITTSIGNRIHKDGSVAMTGVLTLVSTTPSSGNHATHKTYVDAQDALKASLTGATYSGLVYFSGSANPGLRLANVNHGDVPGGSLAAGVLIWDATDVKAEIYSGSQWLNIVTNFYTGNVSITGELTATTALKMNTGGVLQVNGVTVVKGRLTTITDFTLDIGGSIGDVINDWSVPTNMTDSTSGTASATWVAMADPTDTPATADALRDDLVANLIPKIRDNFASTAAEIANLRTAMLEIQNALISLGSKDNEILARLKPSAGHGLIA
jgi:hypothetical protein